MHPVGNKSLNVQLIDESSIGHLDNVKTLINDGANKIHIPLVNASRNGHLDVVEYLVSISDNDYIFNNAMLKASRSGHIDITKVLIKNGANNFAQCASHASRMGHIEIVKLMITSWILHNKSNGIVYNDISDSDIDDVRFTSNTFDSLRTSCLSCKDRSFDSNCILHNVIENAAFDNNIHIINLVLKLINTSNTDDDFTVSFNNTMSNAAMKGHMGIVELMMKNGADDFISAMNSAAFGGSINMVKFMSTKIGDSSLDTAFTYAAGMNRIDVVNFLLEFSEYRHVPLDIEGAVNIANTRGYIKLATLIEEYDSTSLL